VILDGALSRITVLRQQVTAVPRDRHIDDASFGPRTDPNHLRHLPKMVADHLTGAGASRPGTFQHPGEALPALVAEDVL
jgi:hypothetical protein